METCIYRGEVINSLDIYDSKERYKEIRKASQSGELHCEECGSPLVFHGGKIKVYHFKHRSEQDCYFTHSGESQTLMKLKRKVYEYLKEVYPEDTVIMNYKHEAGIRSHFCILEKKLIVNLQLGNTKVKEWEERREKIKSEGFDVRWYFASEKTVSMEKVSMVTGDRIFRGIDENFQDITFKKEIDIVGESGVRDVVKKYRIEGNNIFELEERYKKEVRSKREEVRRKKEAEDKQMEIERRAKRLASIEERRRLEVLKEVESRERKKGYLNGIAESFVKGEILNSPSNRLHGTYTAAMEKGWNEVADKLKRSSKPEVKAFVISFVLSSKGGAIGYYYKEATDTLCMLNTENPIELVEIKGIKSGNDIVDGSIYGDDLESRREFQIAIEVEGRSHIELVSEEIRGKFRLEEVEVGFYLVKE